MMSEPTIVVSVKLYGLLRSYRPATAVGAPHHPFALTLPAATTIADLTNQLGIPDGFVNAAAVNETAVITPDGHTLHDGDEVSLFPPTVGG